MTRIVVMAIAAVIAFAAPAPAVAKDRKDPEIRIRGAKAPRTRRAVEKVVGASDAAVAKVEGRVQRRKRRLSVRLTFRNEAGEVVGRARYRARGDRQLARQVARGLKKELAALPGPEKPERTARKEREERREEREPEREREDGDDDREVAASDGAGSNDGDLRAQVSLGDDDAPQSWSVAAGPELLARGFSYRDDLFGELREYDLPGALAFGLRADWYPLLDRKLGVAGRVSLAPSFTSGDPSGESYTSSASGFAAGARYRHPVGAGHLTAELDYGAQSFAIEAAEEGGPDPGIPGVSYRYVRAGVGAAWPITRRFTVAGKLAYRHVLATGDIASDAYFPRASARGVDLGVGLVTGLTDSFDVRAGVELERYGYDLAPEPGDARVAGGAVDQYPRFFLRVGYAP